VADVPGSKDVNIFRVTAANAYLQQCEMTIVVVDIKRATTDGGFRKHYVDAHNRRHNGSVILVATRSDVSLVMCRSFSITHISLAGIER
jgi:hypothetical protein